MKNLFNKYLLILAIAFLAFACSDDGGETPDEEIKIEERLVSSELIFTRPAGEIRGLLDAAGFDLGNDQIIYDVSLYKVDYNTKYGSEDVVASGIVLIPEDVENADFFSYAHGTVSSDAQVPTNLPLSDGQLLLYSAIAGTGLVTSVPDFIGFGSSVDIVHPYYVEQPSADAVVDNIRASAELALSLEMSISPDLYLAGYSQGGYVAMAAHKSIEENGLEFFDLKASFPSSGGYQIEGVRDFFFDQFTYSNPFFIGFVAESYRTYYQESLSFLDLFFQEPYASEIPNYYNGDLTGGQINDLLNDTISVLINPEYLNDTNNAKFDVVNDRMVNNSLTDWIPEIPVYMYHGDADITVPYQNSVDSYNTFISNGASEDVVTFTTFPGGTHGTSIGPYLLELSQKLNALRN